MKYAEGRSIDTYSYYSWSAKNAWN